MKKLRPFIVRVALGLALALLISPPALAEDGATDQVNLYATVVKPCCVITLPACDVDYTTARLWGFLICCNPPAPADVSFGWDTISRKDNPADYATWTTAKKLLLGILFQTGISPLQPNTKYYFRARAKADGYTAYGEELCFTTPPALKVCTLYAKDITAAGATIWGIVIGQPGSAKANVSFRCGTNTDGGNPAASTNWTAVQNVKMGACFSAKLINLKPDTTYYFRARAVRNGLVVYGDELSFKTPLDFQVITSPAKNIGSDTVTLYGKVTSKVSSPKIKVSFRLYTSHKDDPAAYTRWSPTQDVSPGTTFSVKITKLNPNTTYYFRALGERNGSICYGDELSFKTSPGKTSLLFSVWDWLFGK